MDHKHILVLLWMLQSFSWLFYKIHLLILSLFPHISNIALILLIFLNFFSWGQTCFFLSLRVWRSSSLLCLEAREDTEVKWVVILQDFFGVSLNRPAGQWTARFPRTVVIVVTPGTWHVKDRRLIAFSYRFCLMSSFWSLLKWSGSCPHSGFLGLSCVLPLF